MKINNKNIVYKMQTILIVLFVFLFLSNNLFSLDLFLSPNATVSLSANSIIKINGNLTLSNNSSLTQGNSSQLYLYGNLQNNGTLQSNNATVIFIGDLNSDIFGTGTTNFYKLVINKDVNSIIVYIDKTLLINNDLDIQNGYLRVNNSSSHTITLNGNLLISSGSLFDASTSGSQTHSLLFSGQFQNNGNINFNTSGGKINITFSGNTDVNLNGSGIFDFNEVVINKSNTNNFVDFDKTFTAPDNFLTLLKGEFKVTGNYSVSNNFFKRTGNDYIVPKDAKFTLNNPNATVNPQPVAGNAILRGSLQISQGNFNIGSTGESNLIYDNTIIDGAANLTINGGICNIYTALTSPDTNRIIDINLSGGTLKIGSGSQITTNNAMFDISNSNSSFTWSSGDIELHRSNNNTNYADYRVLSLTNNVTGGNLIINADAGNQIFEIQSIASVYNLIQNAINNSNITLRQDFNVLNNVILNGTGTDLFKTNSFVLSIGADFTNNYVNTDGFNNGTGKVLLNGNATQSIGGTQQTTFNILSVNKTAGDVELNIPARINSSLRLISNTIFDLNTNDLTLGKNAKIYSDDGINDTYNTFSANHCVINSGSTTPLTGAYLVKEIDPSTSFPLDLHLPISTPGVYTPLKIRLLSGGVNFGTNPSIKVKPVPLEHPDVEAPNVSLTKYWAVKTADLTVNTHGAEIFGYYDVNEVQGSEGSYKVLLYSPNWNTPGAYWRVEPGINNYIDINTKYWYSQQTSILEGDWTIGEQNAGQATYYARADGDYNNPSTWSKIYYDGPVSNTAPNKRSDRIKIQNHTITISNPVAEANLIAVETGTEGRTSGILKISGNNYCEGDTFRLENSAKFYFAHSDGIVLAPDMIGAVRTDVRQFSSYGIYGFWEGQTQVSGNGIPDILGALIVDKTINTTVALSKNTTIRDSLVINEGIFDLSTNSANGYTANRTLIMRGGELVVRSSFPINYTPPTLTVGQITFDGTGNTLIPSSTSVPGVLQYNNLVIKGNRSGNVNFETSGEIKIINNFDISNINFTNNTFRFNTAGSTVRFAKNGGTQNVPFMPGSPNDSLVNLSYYNLIIDNPGDKQIVSSGTSTFLITNNLTLSNGSNFIQDNNNIKLLGNWNNTTGAKFTAATGKYVIMQSPTASLSTSITSRDTTDNHFENLLLQGPGKVVINDNLKVNGNLVLGNGSNFEVNNYNIYLYGNWNNNGGTFTQTNSTIVFENNISQNITKVAGDETFYNIELKNPANLNSNSVGASNNGIIISNNLILTYGRIDARDRFVQVNGTISRPGGGYINSALRRNIPAGTTTLQYEVGYQDSYTPITLNFNGTDGVTGLLQILSDTLTTTSSPVYWSDNVPTSIMPSGSNLSTDKHITRQWKITKPTGSSFSLGSNRKFNATPHFIYGISPNGDLRNGANTTLLDVMLYNGTNWIVPLYYGTRPYVSNRQNDSITYNELTELGTIVVGEPSALTFYTRGNGNWNDKNNWSLVQYDGIAANIYPGETTNNYRAFIGANHQINLNIDATVNNSGSIFGLIAVDSSGVLDLNTHIISGTGEFRLNKYSTIKIGSTDGITATSALGNIQTSTRTYNYNSHNQGTFIYTANGNQNTGDGLPSGSDTIRVLIVDKSSGTVTVNAANTLSVKDSLYVKSGGLNLGNRDINLLGNLRKASGTTFDANGRLVSIISTKQDTISVENYSEGITFYDLTINKSQKTGNVFLDTLTWIQISHNLTFAANNYAKIDAYTRSTQLNPQYVIFDPTATVSGARQTTPTQGGGWVNGQVRKNIAANDAPNTVFEVGDQFYYTPLELDFATGTGSTAGYLAAVPIDGFHPKLYNSPGTLYPVNPNRVITLYWRLLKPYNSTFERGNRNYDVTIRFAHPALTTLLDCVGCADVTYYRGGDSLQWWQTMARNSSYDNSGTENVCGDTRIAPHPTPNFNYNGSTCTSPTSPTSYIKVLGLTPSETFGSTDTFANGDLLLAEYVAGNRNSIRYYNFYSIKDGDWTDPTTWSTVAFNSNVNEALTDPDPNVYPFPVRQYDNALIGNGKTVSLNADIGHNIYNGNPNVFPHAGPSTKVYETGTLDLGTRTLRGNAFKLFKDGKLIIGSSNGIALTANSGNIILGYNQQREYSDTSNIEYVAEGVNTSINSYNVINRNASTHYLESVTVLKSSDNSIITQSITGNKRTFSNYGHNYIWDKPITLIAGQTYYIQINPSNVSSNRRFKAWIDYNYNGNFTNAGEQIFSIASNDTVNVTSANFTVPAGTSAGTTHLRIGLRDNNNDFGPTDNGTGEFEEYTVNIVNPNTVITQISGNGLPLKLASLTMHGRRTNATTELQKSIEVIDSVKIISGILKASNGANSYNIKLNGSFINDTLNGFNPANGTVEFFGEYRDTVRGSQPVTFYNLTVNKAFPDTTITINNDITISNLFNYSTNNNVVLKDNKKITFNQNATLSGTYSKSRMIVLSGTNNAGQIQKIFTTTAGAANPKIFTFPIGLDTILHQVHIYDTASSYTSNPQFTVSLRNGKHPTRFTDSTLNMYWTVNATNFTNIDTLTFQYHPLNVTGDTNKYIPGLLSSLTSSWNIDLGINPWAKSSPILSKSTINFNGDWTAGEPRTFSKGRIYYSINTGYWDDYLNWSTDPILKHSGPPTSYPPGSLFPSDTVNIDGHIITFRSDSISIDSLRIGGTNTNPGIGQLIFANSPTNKKLSMRELFLDNDAGSIITENNSTGVDTLEIYGSITNNAQTNGINFTDVSTNHTLEMRFTGAGNSFLSGNGIWSNIQNVRINKPNGLLDTLIISSATFSQGSMLSEPKFYFQSGVLKGYSGQTTLIGGENFQVNLLPSSGIYMKDGSIQTKYHLSTSSNSTIELDGGNILVGNGVDDNYYYQTGTNFKLITGNFIVGGAFLRQNASATIDLTINNLSTIVVARYGATGTDPSFDIRSTGSAITMTGGRIIVANGNDNTESDLTINAENGGGITGGSIQIGDTSYTTSTNDLKISGSTPIYNLHLVDNGTLNTFKTKIRSLNYLVKNQILIDPRQELDINGNILTLQGNLLNYGKLTATPLTPSSQSWQIILNGINDQYLKNYSSAQNLLEIYSLRIDKTTGNTILGDNVATNSNLKVNEHLEFAPTNTSLIDANTYSQKVIIGPNNSSLGTYQFSRNGLGHIWGTLSRYIPNGNQNVDFYVGSDTLASYRPVSLLITGSSNTDGYIDVTPHNVSHPDISNSGLLIATTIPRYWTVVPSSTQSFALGSGGKYQIGTTFLNPADIPSGASLNLFEHRLFSPAYPAAGAWSQPSFVSNSSTNVVSKDNIIWGDFVVGEPNTVSFYSINNGNWQDINSWSLSGYTTNNPPTRIPNQSTDIVHIGNGKTITLVDDGTYPNIRNVIVEKYNNLPGYLQINGQLTYIRGLVFQLDDSCSLGIQHIDGLRPVADGNVGPIQTNARLFGVSRYIFNSNTGNQITGKALPNYVQSIIVDNSTNSSNKKVFLTNYPGAPTVNIIDSLFIRQGTFNSGNRNIRLLGNLVIDSIFNDGKYEALSNKVIIDSNLTHKIVLKNKSGLSLFDLELANGTSEVYREGSKITYNTHLNVANSLNFSGPAIIELKDSVNLYVSNSDVNSIINYASDRYVRTSRTSGMLIRNIGTSGLPLNYVFPIGSYESANNYTPLELSVVSATTSGKFGARVSPGDKGGFPGGHSQLSSAPNAEYLKRFWKIDSVTAVFQGQAKFYYKDLDVFGYDSHYDRLGRWRPSGEKTPGLWTQYPNPTVDTTQNFFLTNSNFNSTEFSGDWTLGNMFAFRRIFFSRQNGNWSDPNSWTYNPTHSGPIFGAGIWPDNTLDSTVIGGGDGISNPHEIVLDVDANVQGTALGTSPTNRGILNTTNHTLSGLYFTMGDYSTLKIGSPQGISSLGNNTGSILTTQTRNFNTNGIYEYNGISNQNYGSGLPVIVYDLLINNSGGTNNNIVLADKNIDIQRNISILQGALNLQTYTANSQSGTGNASINANARLIIGGNNNLLTSFNNYSNYSIDIDSYIEFSGGSGNTQIINLLPNNLTSGLGNVDLTYGGTKIANNSLLIRGNLHNYTASILQISQIDALQVKKNVINESQIINSGILEIGE